jgi:lysophospholipid acyltransferase (LPLAT)-like uncharacterized protein
MSRPPAAHEAAHGGDEPLVVSEESAFRPAGTAASPPLPWKERALPALAALFIRALRATLRVEHHGDERQRVWEREGRHFVIAFWHRHLLLMPYSYRGRRICVLISASRDGERIARTVARFGIDAARGSSSRRGAAGLRELLRRARDGWDIAFTPDGPRGPARLVQPGVALAAMATGLPVVPIAYAATRQWELPSWDRFVVPKPGSRVAFVHGEPLVATRDDDLVTTQRRLQEALLAAEAEAERRAGR